MILRRNTNYGQNQNVPTIDFGSSEAFTPALGTITLGNLGGDQVGVEVSLITANGASAPHYSADVPGSPTSVSFAGFPDSLLRPGDFHSVGVGAIPATGNDFRFAAVLTRSVGGQIPISFGPRASGVSMTTIATSPYLRLKAQAASDALMELLGPRERRALAAVLAPSRLFRSGQVLAHMPYVFVR